MDAVAMYRSQISTFWPGPAEMRNALHERAMTVAAGKGLAERLWLKP